MGTNADVVRRLTDEAFIAGNFDTWDEIIAGDLVDNDPMPGLPPNGEGIKMLAQMVVGTFDDRKIEAEHLESPDGRGSSRTGSSPASTPVTRWASRRAVRRSRSAASRSGVSPTGRSPNAGAWST